MFKSLISEINIYLQGRIKSDDWSFSVYEIDNDVRVDFQVRDQPYFSIEDLEFLLTKFKNVTFWVERMRLSTEEVWENFRNVENKRYRHTALDVYVNLYKIRFFSVK